MIERKKRRTCAALLLVALASACAARAPVSETVIKAASPATSEDSSIDVPNNEISASGSFDQPQGATVSSSKAPVVKAQQARNQSQQTEASNGNDRKPSVGSKTPASKPNEQTFNLSSEEEITNNTANVPPANAREADGDGDGDGDQLNDQSRTTPSLQTPFPLTINQIQQTGKLVNKELSEVSGFAASRAVPGALYAINDSGNSASLYALSETGRHLAQWTIEGKNRDWEDIAAMTIDGQHFLVIGDTGDNLKVHKSNRLYFFSEPLLSVSDGSNLQPDMTLEYTYEDGPRNVEAFAVHDHKVLLISKEPLQSSGSTRSRLYELSIPRSRSTKNLTARFLTELPLAPKSLESSLAARFASVDLDHITALDFDRRGRRAFLLTYREVRVVERSENQSWEEALQSRGKRLHFHNLGQSEALAVTADEVIFITSENRGAQIWAIPAN